MLACGMSGARMLRDSKATLIVALVVVIGCGSNESDDRPGPPGTGTSPQPEPFDASTSPSAGGSGASGGSGGSGTGGSDGGEGGTGGASPSDASSNPLDTNPAVDFRDGAPPGPVCPEPGSTCVDYCNALSRSTSCVDVFNSFEPVDGGLDAGSDAAVPDSVIVSRCECDCEMRIRTGCGGFFDEYIVCAAEPLELVCALEPDSGQPLPEVVGACGSIADQLFTCLEETAVPPDAG